MMGLNHAAMNQSWMRQSFVSFVIFCSRFVCTEQRKPPDSVNELDLMEVEQRLERDVCVGLILKHKQTRETKNR